MATHAAFRILVLEDDQVRIDRFRTELCGYSVDYADSVEGASRLLSGPKYDLLFLDHDLEFGRRVFIDSDEPNTGYQFAKSLATEPSYGDTPVVVHSLNWFGAEKMVEILPCAVHVPFGRYPIGELAKRLLAEGICHEIEILKWTLETRPVG
jgi:CheY-like chemotaxis protein